MTDDSQTAQAGANHIDGFPGVPRGLSARHAAILTTGLFPVMALFIFAGYQLAITPIFMSFLFATYWGAIKHMAPTDFYPAIGGALVGIGMAYLFYILSLALGVVGSILGLAVLTVFLFLLATQWVPTFINASFVLFLTVAAIPAVSKEHDFLGMAEAVVAAALYFRVLLFIFGKVLAKRR
jgi:hypothetical protein